MQEMSYKRPTERVWYRDRKTLVALITGAISSTLTLINIFISM